jgi:hypothetical protein
MARAHFSSKRVLLGVALCSLAALEYFWLSHLFERLPADYRQTTQHAAKCRYRSTPTAEWADFELIATRTDETLVSGAGVLKIQGHMDWTTQSGEVTYDHSGLYGVDRESRANLPGFGNHERSGQFLFPPHTEKTTYKVWDPFYSGPHTATFSHVETRGSLELYVFNGETPVSDDTEGFLPLPDVPEKYRAFSSGAGKIWVEPRSGWVVDFQDAGVSYFVDAESGARLADFYYWDARFTDETKAAQTTLAEKARLRSLLLEIWVPLGLAASGLLVLAAARAPSSSAEVAG